MISRYSRPALEALWSEEAKLRTWLDIEIAACEALMLQGKVPKEAWEKIRTRATFDAATVLEKEKETRHDVAAFVSVVQESIGPEGRYIHWGLTSSDVVDTAFAYRLKKSAELISQEWDAVIGVLKKMAERDKKLLAIGRTHGIHAEPMAFGQKWLDYFALFTRVKKQFDEATRLISIGKLSGAVGNYREIPPEVEAHVCKRLGLTPELVATQVIPRDRFASFFLSLALLGSAIERVATELRHLQRTEVGEAREGFSRGQKGSSAMPHKRNPITAENLTGLARLLRSYALPALENCALWHERDISHSSVERVIGPDACILADYALSRLKTLLENLEVFPLTLEKNLKSLQGVVFSQSVLLALIDSGWTRDKAYTHVQKAAHTALDTATPFLNCLEKDSEVITALGKEKLHDIVSYEKALKNTDRIFERTFSGENV